MARKQPLYPHMPKSKVERLPVTVPDGDKHKGTISLEMTREQATATIISNLIQGGILLASEADRYRKVLDSYDNMTLLKVFFDSGALKEARYGSEAAFISTRAKEKS